MLHFPKMSKNPLLYKCLTYMFYLHIQATHDHNTQSHQLFTIATCGDTHLRPIKVNMVTHLTALSYLSRSLADHWGTTVDFTTSFLHSSQFSAFRSSIFHSRPVYSLMLSSHLHALKAATELLIEEDCKQQNIVLLSDSLSALQSLTNGPTDFRTQQLHNSLRTLSDNNRVVLQWVPAHVGIAGNETADRLAKAAAKLPQPHFSTTYREVKTLLKQKQKSAWRLRNNGYDPQKDQINTLDRRTQTTIFRLRTGHCGLRKHLKRLGLADSAHCECGSEEQTPEHILQTCPHLETVRQQFWPEDTEVGTKLWGQAAKLQWTADFLAATGLRI